MHVLSSEVALMATLPRIADWLKVEESARLLHAIFPNYPALYPCRPIPPREEWLTADNFPTVHALIAGAGVGC